MSLFKFDVREAAKTTYDVAASLRYFEILRTGEDWITRDHILWMLNQIMSGEVEGDKANRWLAWAQAVMCCAGVDHEAFEDINTASHR